MLAFAVFACAALRPPPLATTKIAGDVGFDPLRLAALDVWALAAPSKRRPAAELLRDYRDAELKHGRLAMLAVAGWPLSEFASGRTLAEATNGRAPSLFNGHLLDYTPFLAGFFGGLAAMEFMTKDKAVKEMEMKHETVKKDRLTRLHTNLSKELEMTQKESDAALACYDKIKA